MFRIFRPREDDDTTQRELITTRHKLHDAIKQRDDFHRRLTVAQSEYASLRHLYDQVWDANRSLLRDLRAARAALTAAGIDQEAGNLAADPSKTA